MGAGYAAAHAPLHTQEPVKPVKASLTAAQDGQPNNEERIESGALSLFPTLNLPLT